MKFRTKFLKKAFFILLSTTAIYIGGSIALIYLPEPSFEEQTTSEQADVEASGLNFAQDYPFTEKYFQSRDGIKLYANVFGNQSQTTILLFHGILGSNYTFNTTAGRLKDSTGANVISVDFRGHGRSEGERGDVEYIDQYVDDISDIVKQIREEQPNQRIILAGHSMGGGIAMRYVMKEKLEEVNAYLLFAPALGWNSPTTRKEGSSDSKSFSQSHIARFIGLAMLNSIGIKAFNHKSVLYFNLGEEKPLTYSYRSIASISPEDAALAFSMVDKPLMVIVGTEDQIFHPEEFGPLLRNSSEGQVELIENANHNSVHYDLRTMKIVKDWFEQTSTL